MLDLIDQAVSGNARAQRDFRCSVTFALSHAQNRLRRVLNNIEQQLLHIIGHRAHRRNTDIVVALPINLRLPKLDLRQSKGRITDFMNINHLRLRHTLTIRNQILIDQIFQAIYLSQHHLGVFHQLRLERMQLIFE